MKIPRLLKYLWCRIVFHKANWHYEDYVMWFTCYRCGLETPMDITKKIEFTLFGRHFEYWKYRGYWK